MFQLDQKNYCKNRALCKTFNRELLHKLKEGAFSSIPIRLALPEVPLCSDLGDHKHSRYFQFFLNMNPTMTVIEQQPQSSKT